MLAEFLGIDPMNVFAETVEGFEKRVGPISNIYRETLLNSMGKDRFARIVELLEDADVFVHDQLRHYR